MYETLAILIGLTQDDDEETKKAVAMKAMLLAFIIVGVFCISGNNDPGAMRLDGPRCF